MPSRLGQLECKLEDPSKQPSALINDIVRSVSKDGNDNEHIGCQFPTRRREQK